MTSMVTSKFILCGVKPGYHNATEFTPTSAAKTVQRELENLGTKTTVYPAVVIYSPEHGCPIGGEPVGAFRLSDKADNILGIAQNLRKTLNQSTLSVSLPGHGVPMLGFTAFGGGSLGEVGKSWQTIAGQIAAREGTYVSAGIIDNGDGTVIVSAEANPKYVKNLDVWKNIIGRICAQIGASIPKFEEVGYNYLTKEKSSILSRTSISGMEK